MQKYKVLEVGPGITSSKGGMASVIKQIAESPELTDTFDISTFASYADGLKSPDKQIQEFKRFIEFRKIAQDYDLIHIHMTAKGSALRKTPYIFYAKKTGKPVIVHIHCCEYFIEQYNKRNFLYQFLVRKALKSADLVIDLSEKTTWDLKDKFNLKRCICLPNGINPELYYSSGYKTNAVYLGKLSEDKGTSILLNVMKKCQDNNINIKMTICGNANETEYPKMAKELNLHNVTFAGWTGPKETRQILSESSILVLPSVHEGAPVAVLEGMSSGCAIIATRVGAVPDMVPDELISKNKKECEEQLYERLVKLSHNTSLAKKEGERNKKIVEERFAQNKIFNKLKDIYLDVLTKRYDFER